MEPQEKVDFLMELAQKEGKLLSGEICQKCGFVIMDPQPNGICQNCGKDPSSC